MGSPIELKLILNGTFAYVDRLEDFKEILASIPETKLFIVKPSPYANSRERFGGMPHQSSAQTYLDLKASHFAVLFQNCWFLLLSGEFESLEDYEVADKVGCTNQTEYRALQKSGFGTAAEMKAASLLGFQTKSDVDQAEALGCKDAAELRVAREGGFVDAESFKLAQQAGIRSFAEWTEYNSLEKTRVALDLNSHDEAILADFIDSQASDIDLTGLRLHKVLGELKGARLPHQPRWFISGTGKFGLLAERLLGKKKTADFRYDPNQDLFILLPTPLSNDRIVVDGSNVAWAGRLRDSDERPALQNVLRVVGDLFAKGFIHIQVYFDANISYDVSDAAILKKLKNIAEVQVVPAGNQADRFVLEYSQKHSTRIVSNDKYSDFEAANEWLSRNRQRLLVPYSIHETSVTYEKTLRDAPTELT